MSKKNLTVEHVEHASNNQLAKLLGVHPSATSHWLKRNFRFNNLSTKYKCIDMEALTAGFVRRRNNAEKARKLQKEFDEILNATEKIEKQAVA